MKNLLVPFFFQGTDVVCSTKNPKTGHRFHTDEDFRYHFPYRNIILSCRNVFCSRLFPCHHLIYVNRKTLHFSCYRPYSSFIFFYAKSDVCLMKGPLTCLMCLGCAASQWFEFGGASTRSSCCRLNFKNHLFFYHYVSNSETLGGMDKSPDSV